MPHIWNDARFSFDIKLYKMSVSSLSSLSSVYLVFIKMVRMKAAILVMVVEFPGGVLAVVRSDLITFHLRERERERECLLLEI